MFKCFAVSELSLLQNTAAMRLVQIAERRPALARLLTHSSTISLHNSHSYAHRRDSCCNRPLGPGSRTHQRPCMYLQGACPSHTPRMSVQICYVPAQCRARVNCTRHFRRFHTALLTLLWPSGALNAVASSPRTSTRTFIPPGIVDSDSYPRSPPELLKVIISKSPDPLGVIQIGYPLGVELYTEKR
jgi:hypothetical protein